MNKLIIAIDGYAATGKSTQAKLLAKKLNYTYIDSGAMYRAVTLFAYHQEPKGTIDTSLLLQSLDQINIRFEGTASQQHIFLNGREVSKALRTPEINKHVSQVAALEGVRNFLTQQQQIFGADKKVVMDGRDIGTVVFPKADCKFFFTASAEVRAKRRYEEQLLAGINESFEKVLASVKERDTLDTTRTISPLLKAKDAIEIDVSLLTIQEVFDLVYGKIREKIH